MPSRKQRRRREKNFRHEYETVLLEADGTEHALEPGDLRTERAERDKAKAAARPARSTGTRQRGSRPIREVSPPSWDRALRRGGLFGGLMLVAFLFLFKNESLALRLGWGLFYAIAFIPLTYWVDRTTYRAYQRRVARQSEKK